MTRRLLALFALGFSVYACGGTHSTTPTSPTQGNQSSPTSPPQLIIYQNDDGTVTNAASNLGATSSYVLERYDVLAGAEKILGIQVRWGALQAPADAALYLWSGQSNSSDLAALSVQRFIPASVGVVNIPDATPVASVLPTSNYYFTTPITLPVGSSFFVGTWNYRPIPECALVPPNVCRGDQLLSTLYTAYEDNEPHSGRSFRVNFSGVQTGGALGGGTVFDQTPRDFVIRAIATAK